jgi:PAS domain S-box-containing protein
MKLTITSKTAVFAVLTVALLAYLATIFYDETAKEIGSGKQVAHIEEVIAKLETTLAAARELESAQRGYVISGELPFKQEVADSEKKLSACVDELAKVTADNPKQQQMVVLLRDEVNQRMLFAQRVVREREKTAINNSTQAWDSVASGEGSRLSMKIDATIQSMEGEENKLLSSRANTFELAAQSAVRDMIWLVLFAFAMLAIIIVFIRHYEVEQRVTEEALRNAAIKFLGIFNQSFEAIALLDLEGKVLQVNNTAIEQIGLEREKLLGMPYWETPWWTYSLDTQERIKQYISDASGGKRVRAETKVSQQDGQLFDADFMLKPVQEPNGDINFLVAEFHDLSMIKRTEQALKENEARMRSIFASMEEGLYQLDENGSLIYLNPAGAKMLGYDADAIRGSIMHDLIHFKDAKGEHASLQKCPVLNVIKTGVSYESRNDLFIKADGSYLPVRILSSPLLIDGEIRGVVVTFQDVSALKTAEQRSSTQYAVTRALAQAETVEESALKVVDIVCENLDWDTGALWLLDEAKGKLEYVSSSKRCNLDLSHFEEECRKIQRDGGFASYDNAFRENAPLWLAANDGGEESEHFSKAIRSLGFKTSFAVPLRREDACIGVIELYSKEARPADLELMQMFDALGRQFGQFMERRRVDAELLESQEIFRQLSGNISEIFWITDPLLTKCFYCSPAYEVIWGLPVEDVLKDPRAVMQIVAKEDRKRVAEHLSLENLKYGPSEIEYRIRRLDGEERWIWAKSFPIKDEDGQIIRLCGIAHDMTERKEIEKRVSEFYSTVSHELRTPLTSIRAALGLIEGGLAGEVTAKASQLVRIARTESDRLIRLINDILDIRKIEAGKFELSKADFKVDELIADSLHAVEAIAHEANVELKVDNQTKASLNCDKDRIVQVLANLISNAIKFSSSGSDILIQVESSEGLVKFKVKDRGPGIHPDQMHKLFGKFEQHGGKIGVDTNFGEGATFWFELPAREVINLSLDLSVGKGAPRVLLVEDDRQLVELLGELLTTEGYLVSKAYSLSQAESAFKEFRPDVILLDILLPDGNGLDWVKQVKGQKGVALVPIVVLTGHEAESNHYGQPRLIDWLTKPFDSKRLKQALKVAVSRQGKDIPKVLVVDDDLATREVVIHQLKQLGVTCLEAKDGAEAIHLVRTEHPDLIILDIGLPNPDGFGVVQILRQEEACTTPLIVYTSRDITADDVERLTLGLSRHLVKSRTSESQFVITVRELLRGVAPFDKVVALPVGKVTD